MDKQLTQALHSCLGTLEVHPVHKRQMAAQIAQRRKRRHRWLIVLAVLLLTASAYAAARPAILDWLLGDAPASEPLANSAQVLMSEATAGHMTVRITGAVYDSSQLSLSYEVENLAPDEAILYAVEPTLLINGHEVPLLHASAMVDAPRMVPSPHLDVLPVQRNPVAGGIWCSLPEALPKEQASCEVRFAIYRPEKGFVLVDEPTDAPEAELLDRLQTLRAMQNVTLVQEEAENWLEQGYTVLGSTASPMYDEWHLTQAASIAVPFTLDASIPFVVDLSGQTGIPISDGTLLIRRFRLTALSTQIELFIVPTENSQSAANQLARCYGALRLTDPMGQKLLFSEMDYLSSPEPTVTQQDGQWCVRYSIDMPGLLSFPESISLTVDTGELHRFPLSPT